MKKRTRILSAAVCAALVGGMVPVALGAQNNTASAGAPVTADTTQKKWAAKLGDSAMTPQTLSDSYIYAASGSTLYKIDLSNGSYDSAELKSDVSDTEDALTVADGMVFVPITGGKIQAFDADSLKSLWVSEERSDEVDTSITYEDGMIYAGTASGYIGMTTSDDDTENTTETKSVTWSTDIASGSDVYVDENAVIFGGADGNLYALDAEDSANKLDSVTLDSPAGSSLIAEDGVLYFTAENGTLYRVPVQSGGAFGDAQKYDLGGTASAPTVENGRIYAGVSGGSDTGTGSIAVLTYDETDGLTKEYSVETNGFAKGAPLAIADGDDVQVYYTTLETSGALYTFTDSADSSSAEDEAIYTPSDEMAGAGGTAVSADSSGNLYYKLGTGELIALEEKESDDVNADPKLSKVSASRKVNDTSKAKIKLNASKKGTVYYVVTDASVTEAPDVYTEGKSESVKSGSDTITIDGLDNNKKTVWLGLQDENGKTSEVKSVTLEQVISAEITVTPKKATLKVKSGGTKLTPADESRAKDGVYIYNLVVGESYKLSASHEGYESSSETITAKANKTSYKVTLKSQNSKLSYLSVSSSLTNQTADFTLSPTFQPSVTEYKAKTNADTGTVYLWLRASSNSAKCTVYGTKGVDASGMNSKKKISGDSYGGYERYAVKLKSSASRATLTIKVKSDSGTTGTYTVKVQRADKTAPVISNITTKTKRTGAQSATIAIKSSEKATGYLKVANIGVVPTNIVSEGSKFNIKKGETIININGLASIARNIYIVAQDSAGNTSAKLKISIPSYATNTASPSTSRTTTPSSGSTSTVRSGTTATTTPSTGTTTSPVSSGTAADTNSTAGTTAADGTVIDDTATTTVDGSYDTTGTDSGYTYDGATDDALTVDDAEAAVDSTDVEAVNNGSVPDNSVISSGMPTWAVLLIIVIICAAALGGYAFWTKKKQNGKNPDEKKTDDKTNDNEPKDKK